MSTSSSIPASGGPAVGDAPVDAPVDGLLIVDKPAGPTSQRVTARIRRLAGTRKVGHAGTLDPMATGVLVVGVGRSTRLLGHLILAEKEYAATIRLGASTVTDDSQGDVLSTADASGVSVDAVREAMGELTGTISQVPSAVSAIKVDGQRAHRLVRAGGDVKLKAREVTVSAFTLLGVEREGPFLDVQVEATVSSGTYIRALARDIGSRLGVGGHLTALRRTRVGPYSLAVAHTLEQLEEELTVLSPAAAADAAFPRYDVPAELVGGILHGAPLPPTGVGDGPVAVFGPDGDLLALVQDRDGRARYLAVFN